MFLWKMASEKVTSAGNWTASSGGLNPCSCGRWLQRPLRGSNADRRVLILVLVEDGFRESSGIYTKCAISVLILVLVEDGFRGLQNQQRSKSWGGLNPCSCGRWLQSLQNGLTKANVKCLNPCSCGRWLQRL